MKLNFTSFFPRSSTTLENTIFIAHFSHNFSLLCNERKKSYYNYLILKQKHAYIQQFQAVFFLNYKFSKKNYVVSFLPSEYEKQKNLPMFYYNFLRRFWKSSYVIILKVSYFQKYGQIIFLLTFLNVGRLLIGCSVDLSPPIGSLQISKLSTKKAKT